MKKITDIHQLDINGSYTYADYLTWRFMERVELIWGKIRKMTAAPSTKHQKVLGDLHIALRNALGNNPCQVFLAPFDVRLPIGKLKEQEEINVVQPDLCVICDPNKLDEKGCHGTPDLIIEVLSPSSSTRDLKDKRQLYQQAGVPEYWVIDPFDGVAHVFIINEHGEYLNRYPITAEDTLKSETLPNLEIPMNNLFPDILEEPEKPYGEHVVRI
jgi:Uma2 family endonuclease